MAVACVTFGLFDAVAQGMSEVQKSPEAFFPLILVAAGTACAVIVALLVTVDLMPGVRQWAARTGARHVKGNRS